MAPPQPSTSNLLLRKRTSDIGRRRSGQLGAVKRQSTADENGVTELGADSPAQLGAPREAHLHSSPLQLSPAPGLAHEPAEPPVAETPAAEPPHEGTDDDRGEVGDTPTSRFARQLADSHAADAWFDAQLTPQPGPVRSSSSRRSGGAGLATPPVQSAASQIVDKALKYITADRSVATPPGRQANALKSGPAASILDKGLDAISGVGKLMETFAMTLDSVIGQAFEEWGTPGSSKPSERQRAPLRVRNGEAPGSQKQAVGVSKESGSAGCSGGAAGGASTGARGAAGLKQTHMTSFMNRMTDASEEDVAAWHKRAVGLQAELQKLQSQIQENQRLRDEYAKIQSDLQRTATTVSKLEQENTLLKQRSATVAPEADIVGAADPLAAEQVRLQMEALLAEKAKLAQENARLLRENNGLQELLEFTMLAQAEMVGDDELFGEEAPLPPASWSEPPSSSAGTSPKSSVGPAEYPERPPTAAMAQLAL